MKDGEKADPGAQVFGVSGDGTKCPGGGAKEQVVEETLVLESQIGQGPGQGEDEMEHVFETT